MNEFPLQLGYMIKLCSWNIANSGYVPLRFGGTSLVEWEHNNSDLGLHCLLKSDKNIILVYRVAAVRASDKRGY